MEVLRNLQAKGDVDAHEHAVKECIRNGILVDYLTKKGSEVINMLIAEYDYDLDIEVQREEAFEAGKAAGKVTGELEGRDKLLYEQIRKNFSKGRTPEEMADVLGVPVEKINEIILSLKK